MDSALRWESMAKQQMLIMVAERIALAGIPIKMTYAQMAVMESMMVGILRLRPPNNRMNSWKIIPICNPLTASI